MFESSSFSQKVLHIHRSVHVRFLAWQEHLCEDQFVLHWHLTISVTVFSAWRTWAVVGLSGPRDQLTFWQPCFNGSMDQEMSAWWEMAACPHTYACTCTRMICCRIAPTVGWSLSYSAMFSQKRCHRSSGMLDILISLGQYAEQTNLVNDVNTSSDSPASLQSSRHVVISFLAFL